MFTRVLGSQQVLDLPRRISAVCAEPVKARHVLRAQPVEQVAGRSRRSTE